MRKRLRKKLRLKILPSVEWFGRRSSLRMRQAQYEINKFTSNLLEAIIKGSNLCQ